MKKITKQIGKSTWEITYPDDIGAELAKASKEGYHVSDWAWQHAYCIGKNLDTKKERWLPKNYIDMLLEEDARENFMGIYCNPNNPNFDYNLIDITEFHRDFDKCWAQLRTRKEKEDFAINCCYYEVKKTGECKVYFHVFDLNEDCYDDLELEEYRSRDRRSFKMWNSISEENC